MALLLTAELVFAFFGVAFLVRGRADGGGGRVVTGAPARIAGLVLLLPVPLTYFGVFALLVTEVARGHSLDPRRYGPVTTLYGFIAVVACFVTAAFILKRWARLPADEQVAETPDWEQHREGGPP